VETSTPCKQDNRVPLILPSVSPVVDKGQNISDSDSMEVDQHHEGMSGNLECDISPPKGIYIYYVIFYCLFIKE
jgi:hypothetical protein